MDRFPFLPANHHRRPYLLLGLLLFGAACQPREGREDVRERLLMRTSFEELKGWRSDSIPSLTTEKVHSGRYALRVDAAQPYSATFRAPLGSLSSQQPRRITLSAWVWVPTPQDDARLMVIVNNGAATETLFDKSVFLSTTGPFGEWKKVSRSFDLPGNIHHDHYLVVYLWNGSAAHPVYTDDWELTELR